MHRSPSFAPAPSLQRSASLRPASPPPSTALSTAAESYGYFSSSPAPSPTASDDDSDILSLTDAGSLSNAGSLPYSSLPSRYSSLPYSSLPPSYEEGQHPPHPPSHATPPADVLGSSLSSQRLYEKTAGTRPAQPPLLRERLEAEWAKNYERSAVPYEEAFGLTRENLTQRSQLPAEDTAEAAIGPELQPPQLNRLRCETDVKAQHLALLASTAM